jgi:hypothetical protein
MMSRYELLFLQNLWCVVGYNVCNSKEGDRVTDWPSGSLSPVNGKLPFPHRNIFWNIVNLVSLNIQIKGLLLLF